MENTLENKLNKLGITSERVNEIERLTYIPYYIEGDTPFRGTQSKVIDLDDLVGVCRWDADKFTSWIDVLDSLHKMRNFTIFNKQSFEKIIINPPSHVNTPEVVEIEGELYIEGEGKHRLTMAKCLGVKKAKVQVNYLK
ncbi:hypothetical protein [Bacillus fungorum]|uniref:ParB/Sulfiredoxin domain-containing protein n=1 Tax=Bacillus fungorum TaxID=2039284 RepID=A0A2G6Q5F0_9BACI|nr:hypothetical protein [Bacillus fungorum]PIE92021.1 hypothetical protein CO726_28900 [Bacillus fungorum]